MNSKGGAKGFFKMNHLRPVSSEVALEVRLASCARSDLQTLRQDRMTPSCVMVPAVCPQKKAMQMGGRQDAGLAMFLATLGDALSGKWRPWQGGITEMSFIALAHKVL